MTPRPRKHKGLPDYLYKYHDKRTGKWYFQYKHPSMTAPKGMGTDKAAAIEAAKQLNSVLASPRVQMLVSRATFKGMTVKEWDRRYSEILADRELSANTLRSFKSLRKQIVLALGDKRMDEVMTLDCSDMIKSEVAKGHRRSAVSLRTRLVDFFKTAEAEGVIKRGTNPAEIAAIPKYAPTRKRLTLELFQQIAKAAESMDPWIANSMWLALLSGQRREDIASIQWKPSKSATAYIENDHLHVIQKKTSHKKTGSLVRLPLDLCLVVVGMSLRDAVERCRDNVLSRYLLHHTVNRANARPGSQVHIDTISRRFADARKLAGVEVDNPPTFHEIRSLSIRLYRQQGEDAQGIAGHKQQSTTDGYVDGRGHIWTEVRPRVSL